MSNLEISIEHFSDDLMTAYSTSGMERGKVGRTTIKWVFGTNSTPFSVARHEGKIVGMSGYVKSNMVFDSSQGITFQAIDSFVSEAARGKGIFTRLAQAYEEYASDLGADMFWGFPNDNAAPAWFGKLGWHSHGQVPFLIKPLRAGFFCRKLGIPLDFPLSTAKDQNIKPITEISDWANTLWDRVSPDIKVGTIRDKTFLNHRLFDCPHSDQYRVVASNDHNQPAIVATRHAEKHGGKIAYVMEALGTESLDELLMSELGYLKSIGVEIALAWAFPWSPNYKTLRKAGFISLPQRLRPINIWFGSKPKTEIAKRANRGDQWYLSYLDSDTV